MGRACIAPIVLLLVDRFGWSDVISSHFWWIAVFLFVDVVLLGILELHMSTLAEVGAILLYIALELLLASVFYKFGFTASFFVVGVGSAIYSPLY